MAVNLDQFTLEDIEEAIRIKKARDSLLMFTEMTMPDYTSSNKLDTVYEAALHHKAICEALEQVERGQITRLIITTAPRHGKSELVSRRFTPWFMGKNRNRQVIFATYNAEFAGEFGQTWREIMETERYKRIFPGVVPKATNRSKFRLEIERGNMAVAVGAGGSITGRGADCVVNHCKVSSNRGDIPIREIKVGDEVLGYDHKTGKQVWTRVKAVRAIPIGAREIIKTGSLETTSDHRIFTKEKGYVSHEQYKTAKVLTPITIEMPKSDRRDFDKFNEADYVVDIQTDTENFFCEGILVHNCLIIDDPIKNRQEAESLLIRNNIWDWYTSTAYTRLMPGGRVVIIMTRWHEDDLLGRLLSTEYMSQDQIDRWTIIDLPAIANENTDKEKALWPQKYPLEVLKQTREVVGARDWNALYQQRPTPPEGAFFKRNMIEPYTYSMEELPDKSELTNYTSFDLAVSKAKKRDATCCGTGGLDKNDVLWILPEIYWEKRDADESVEMIGEHIIHYDPIAIYCEKGQLDKAVGPFLEKYLSERKIYKYFEKLPVSVNKGARATSLRGRMQQGKVRWPKDASWWPAAFDQLLKFTGSGDDKEDDFVDMVAQLGQGLHRQYHINAAPGTTVAGTKIGTLAWVKEDSNYRRKQLAAQRGQQGW